MTTLIVLHPDGTANIRPRLSQVPDSPVAVWQWLEEQNLARADIRTWHVLMNGTFAIVEAEA